MLQKGAQQQAVVKGSTGLENVRACFKKLTGGETLWQTCLDGEYPLRGAQQRSLWMIEQDFLRFEQDGVFMHTGSGVFNHGVCPLSSLKGVL